MLMMTQLSPTLVAKNREGVPGRRSGGGTRWTVTTSSTTASLRNRLAALAFASRTHLPSNLKVKALFTGYIA